MVLTRRHVALLVHARRCFSASAVPRPACVHEVRRLALLRRFSDIESLLEPLKDSKDASSEPFLASVAAAYASAGMVEHAFRTLEDLPRLGSPRTALSLNALLSALNHSPRRLGHHRLVPELFSDVPRKFSIVPDAVSYGILVKYYCLAGESKKAFPIIKEMEEKKIEVTSVIYTTILDSLYKDSKPQEAETLWKEMGIKGVKPDLPAYNVRVMHKALVGKPDEVLDLIAEMEAAGLEPDIISYNYLIACYCKHRKTKDAKKVYHGLEEKGCVPNSVTFMNLLSALSKNRDFVGCMKVLADCIKHSNIPDLGSIKLLVKELVKASRPRDARRVITRLEKKFPEDFVGDWKKLEKLVSRSKDVKKSDQKIDAPHMKDRNGNEIQSKSW
ncbi:pentatricopeptide repeat-containing protein At4g36680, mitochondrial-like [Zingiber officinale]|uniref:pentatricopeptide repeat-containing protein At4g36680, mitochondrial-like n=1 Tax=Zingiber officinale TaxID=94328 RepID=UPI001C4BD993|nr:pentatricopeptide repeat-containing protein At4g36680, mitochondrial-like [Zingiber officinale]